MLPALLQHIASYTVALLPKEGSPGLKPSGTGRQLFLSSPQPFSVIKDKAPKDHVGRDSGGAGQVVSNFQANLVSASGMPEP